MTKKISIFDYLDYRAFLRDALEKRKAEKAGFSLRYVAQRMGINPGFFNRALKGERNLSAEHILRLCEILKLDAKQKQYFELLVQYNQAKGQIEKDHYFDQLDVFRHTKVKEVLPAQYAMYRHWYYVVLRELVNVVERCDDSDEACKALSRLFEPRIAPAQVREALVILEKLKIVKRDAKGTYALRDKFITTGMQIPQVVVNRVLMEFSDLARSSVERITRDERSLTTLTFSVSKRGYERIREKLDGYRQEILSVVDDERENEVDRVYHLNLQLFPVSKPFRGEK
jgi:uncharacterized protein (TIGR02147 family)